VTDLRFACDTMEPPSFRRLYDCYSINLLMTIIGSIEARVGTLFSTSESNLALVAFDP